MNLFRSMLRGGLLVLLVCATAHAGNLPQVAAGKLVRLPGFASKLVPPRHVDVWIPDQPPGKQGYDVLYMHDGQMLFDGGTTWNGQEWRVDEVASELITSGRTRAFIVVGIWNAGPDRHAEYFPQKAFESLSRVQQRALLAQQRSPGQPVLVAAPRSDAYLKFVVTELKPYIDSHFPVQAGRDHTFIMGSSMGGLISMYAVAEYPKVFAGAGCLSTHWPGGMPGPDNPVPQAFVRYMKRQFPPTGSVRIWFDHGTRTLDAEYGPLQHQVDDLMRAKGYGEQDWQSRVYEGAEHTEAAWSQRLAEPLSFLMPAGEGQHRASPH